MRLLTLCSLALLATTPALAVESATSSAAVRHVDYADLNLASEAGRTSLHHRIVYAVNVVCGAEYNVLATDRPALKACRRQAFASADRQMTIAVASATTGSDREMLIALR